MRRYGTGNLSLDAFAGQWLPGFSSGRCKCRLRERDMWFGRPTDALDDAQSGFGAAEFSTGGMQFGPAFEIIGSEGFQAA